WEPVPDAQLGALEETVGHPSLDRLETAVEFRESRLGGAPRLRGVVDALPDAESLLGAGRSGRRAVACIARERDAHREPPFVRDRDRVPRGRLADDAPIGCGERRAIARALAGR